MNESAGKFASQFILYLIATININGQFKFKSRINFNLSKYV
jgi:hypothetical protein